VNLTEQKLLVKQFTDES